MITDSNTGVDLFNDVSEIPPVHINALTAYSTWAAELGVSASVSLGGLVNSDDGSAEIDVGFVYTLGGTDTKLMQSTEGSIGFYTSTSAYQNISRPITKILTEQANITRAYTTRSLNPSMIVSCKHPTLDAKSYDTKWQKTNDTMILFIKWSAFGNSESKRVDLAMRMSKGKLDIVCNTNPESGAYFQIFLMNSTSTSGQAIAGNGNLGKVLSPSTTYQFSTVIAKRLSGTVIGTDGNFKSTLVRAYNRADGELAGFTVSDAVTGEYSIETYDGGEHYLVCFDDSATGLNALVIDRVIPIE